MSLNPHISMWEMVLAFVKAGCHVVDMQTAVLSDCRLCSGKGDRATAEYAEHCPAVDSVLVLGSPIAKGRLCS